MKVPGVSFTFVDKYLIVMIESGWEKVKRFYSGLPTWLIFITCALPILGFVSGWITELGASPGNTRFVLSALAGGQASVLAIVFSVTVIGIQLVADRYSARMISLFTEAPILIFTFSLFIVSIAFDIGLLYNVPQTTSKWHIAGVYTALGLSLSSAITLFTFIRTAIDQSTPEGVIETFVERLTPEKYLEEVEEMVEDDFQNVHPLHPLYSMTMEALSNRNRATAELALDNYGSHTTQMLNEFKRRDSYSDLNDNISRTLFEPVLKEHLHDIALHAEEQDETQLVKQTTTWMRDLGTEGLEISQTPVSRQAVYGLTNVIIHAPVDSGEYVSNNSAWRDLGQILVNAAEHPNPEVVWAAASTIKSRGPHTVRRAHEGRRLQSPMRDIYGSIEKAHAHLLDEYEERMTDIEIDWQQDHVPDDIENREQIDCIHRLRQSIFETTKSFLGYYFEEGHYPITPGNFHDSWRNLCIDASNSEARNYAVALCQAMVEIAYITSCEDEDEESWWTGGLARVKYKGDPEVVEEAFERILSYEYQTEDVDVWIAEPESSRKEEYYSNLISFQGYHHLNQHPDFPDQVKEIQQKVEKNWKQLENR